MKIKRPALEMKLPCRRELLLSSMSSVFIAGGLLGGLAFVSISLATAFQTIDPSGPVMVKSEESEEPEEVEEVTKAYEPSPSVSVPPLSLVPLEQQLVESPDAIPVPEVEEVPVMDDLAWSEEAFEPWEEDQKPEVKPKPKIVRKPAPARKSSPTEKSVSLKPTSARVVSRSAPAYPGSARRAGIEGKVMVLVTVSTSGRVSGALISSSSGNASLDAAALKAARRYRFTPAKNGVGQAVATQVKIPFNFRLN
ncbi:MAG: energy transducer TonB [Akkermansiaceae bacterium]|jgi:protein TonB|nr:energy transducer TonB [Akkermansiaceae bacterium]